MQLQRRKQRRLDGDRAVDDDDGGDDDAKRFDFDDSIPEGVLPGPWQRMQSARAHLAAYDRAVERFPDHPDPVLAAAMADAPGGWRRPAATTEEDAAGELGELPFAASFGALSLWGYTTKRDLTGMGSFLFMGVIGLVIAMLVNIFLQSSALQFAISAIGVLVFAGLTAYDTQKIKSIYAESDGTAVAEKKAIMGALTLYLDFINMFIFLLHLFGNRE